MPEGSAGPRPCPRTPKHAQAHLATGCPAARRPARRLAALSSSPIALLSAPPPPSDPPSWTPLATGAGCQTRPEGREPPGLEQCVPSSSRRCAAAGPPRSPEQAARSGWTGVPRTSPSGCGPATSPSSTTSTSTGSSAEALVRAGVSAVVNAAPSISGRYPNLGPEILQPPGYRWSTTSAPRSLARSRRASRSGRRRQLCAATRSSPRGEEQDRRDDRRRDARGARRDVGAARGVRREHDGVRTPRARPALRRRRRAGAGDLDSRAGTA